MHTTLVPLARTRAWLRSFYLSGKKTEDDFQNRPKKHRSVRQNPRRRYSPHINAFPSAPHAMRPFSSSQPSLPAKIFNYRPSASVSSAKGRLPALQMAAFKDQTDPEKSQPFAAFLLPRALTSSRSPVDKGAYRGPEKGRLSTKVRYTFTYWPICWISLAYIRKEREKQLCFEAVKMSFVIRCCLRSLPLFANST